MKTYKYIREEKAKIQSTKSKHLDKLVVPKKFLIIGKKSLNKLPSEAKIEKLAYRILDIVSSEEEYLVIEKIKNILSKQIQKDYYQGIQLGYTKHLEEELKLLIKNQL